MVRSLNNVERWQQLDETTNQTERLSTLGRVYNRYDRQIKTTLMSSSSIQDILYIYTLFFLNKPDISILNGSNHGWPTLYLTRPGAGYKQAATCISSWV